MTVVFFSNVGESTEEAHEAFMNSYRRIFVHPPKKMLPRIQKRSALPNAPRSRGAPSGPPPIRVGPPLAGAPGAPEGAGGPRRSGAAGRALQNRLRTGLISQATEGLRKFPVNRSRQERQAIQKMLRSFSCLTNQMSAEELRCIADFCIVEAWERGHAVLPSYGFYVVLKGSVRPCQADSTGPEDGPNEPAVLGVGDSFGCLLPQGQEGLSGPPGTSRCVLTMEPSETLKVSHSGYAELRRELQARSFAHKELLVSGCRSCRRWPALFVRSLAHLLTLTRFPADHVLVREGEVPPFAGFIAGGECGVWRSTRGLAETAPPATRHSGTGPNRKGVRARTLAVGSLGAGESFGMAGVLRGQPSHCSVVTATEAQVGVIQADLMRGLDPGIISFILQSTKDAYGNLSQEELRQEYIRQEKAKQSERFKIKILREALFYNSSSRPDNPRARQDTRTQTQGRQGSM